MKIALAFVCLVLVSCSENTKYEPENHTDGDIEVLSTVRTPTKLLSTSDWPEISDDLDFDLLEVAIDRQLEKFSRIRRGNKIRLGRITYGFEVFEKSLLAYKNLLGHLRSCSLTQDRKECVRDFASSLKKYFHMFVPIENGARKKALFTAYHTPVMEVSLNKTRTQQAGIHLRPQEEELRTLTRNEVNFDHALEGSPYEIMYMENFFEQYLLHIQGGGKVNYTDSQGVRRSKYLNYDGTNGQSFDFISLYMRDQGYITNLSNASQKAFLDANPDKWREIYSVCPSMVYFKISEEPPHGNDSVSLTDGRSIATDYRIYKMKGLMTFVQTTKPKRENGNVKWVPMNRFMIDHDTGGAIRGAARGDLYFGEDEYAAFAATIVKNRGDLYFLALKPDKL